MTATYNGTTAGSTSQNPPVLISSYGSGSIQNAPGLTGARVWFYQSTNASTDLTASGSISDGKKLGMQAGDLFFGVYSTGSNSTAPIVYVAAVGAVSTAGAALGGAMTSTMA